MLLAASLAGCTGLATRDPAARRGPAPPPTTLAQRAATIVPNDELIHALRQGGHVLVVQHTTSDGHPDRDGPALNNCEAQGNLTDTGRADAQALGLGFRRMAIPVGHVLASPYCRTRDTAWLAFGQVQVAWSLAPTPDAGPRRVSAAEEFRSLVNAVPPDGTNTVLITHPGTINAMVGASLTPGEALVYTPRRDQEAELERRIHLADLIGLARTKPVTAPALARGISLREYPLPAGTGPYAVTAYPNSSDIWFTASRAGAVGRLDSRTGRTQTIPLGRGSSPRGIAVGPDGALWVADRGRNAILQVNPATGQVQPVTLPEAAGRAELASVRFDGDGRLWFTGQRGVVGALDVASGEIQIFDVPDGAAPDGLTVTAGGAVFYASPASGHVARVDQAGGGVDVDTPPTRDQGVQQAASNLPGGSVWFTEAKAGRIARLNTETGRWSEWRLPGNQPQPSGLYVDRGGQVWVTDLAANTVLRFDPVSERFAVLDIPSPNARILDLTGAGSHELWAAESGTDRLLQIRLPQPRANGATSAAVG